MIIIKNTQRTIPINTKQLHADAQKILELLDYADFDLALWLTTNATIRKYNRTFRYKDKPTDILSFSHHPELRPGKRIRVQEADDKNLGDLIIAPRYVRDDLSKWNRTLDERMRDLLVHGICHLLGYDHIEDADFRVMRKKELWLLRQLPPL